jgi:succinate dehydrogenase / fumarate reductase, cytochrome b subunit
MSSLVKKYLMALTGLVLVGFVLGHMAGNLQMFLHPDWINEYAYKLQHLPYGLLWVVRGSLLVVVVVHIVTAVMLVIENRKARPRGYVGQKALTSSFAARTMRWSGVILLAFIVYHVLHYTVRVDGLLPAYTKEVQLAGKEGTYGRESRTLWGVYDKLSAQGSVAPAEVAPIHNVYGMVAAGFSSPLVSLAYIIAMGLLLMHLSHGISSMFQSLGLRNTVWRQRLDRVALVLSIVLFIGFASLPAAGLLGAFDGDADGAAEVVDTASAR